MLAMNAPDKDSCEVYQTCIDSIANEDLRNRLNVLTNDIAKVAADYQKRGRTKQLYTLPSNDCKNDEIVLGKVTKQELINVYSKHMVVKAKPARIIYDDLLSRAPFGRCPFCGTGHASTLDHYLPKTKYPLLSVVPLNLVPSCKDCNKSKGGSFASIPETQNLHPYFDGGAFISEQWLFSEIEIKSSSLEIRYFVRAPKNWDALSKQRIKSHFISFNLETKYSIEAINEFFTRQHLIDKYKRTNRDHELADLFDMEFKSSFESHVNSWKTSLYQSLAKLYGSFIQCPICLGKNFICNDVCPACGGKGEILESSRNETIEEFLDLPCICGEQENKGCKHCAGSGRMKLEIAQKHKESIY